MQQKPLIYVSRVTNLSDARYCAGMGVDMIGFSIDTSGEDFVSAQTYQELVGWIAGPKRVIEIPDGFNGNWDQIMQDYKPDMLHVSYATALKAGLPDIPVMMEITYDTWVKEVNKFQSLNIMLTNIIVTDFPEELKASQLPARQFPVFLSLDPSVTTVEVLVDESGADGIVLRGSREQAPGLKDYDHLARILEELDEIED